MAELTIQFRYDPQTGKKEIVIALRPDEDLIPLECEQQHRALVETLLGNGLWQAAAEGKIVVERPSSNSVIDAPPSAAAQSDSQPSAAPLDSE
jgi:hypothetical protein